MKKILANYHKFTMHYIDWVIRLGRVKFSIFGVVVLAVFALVVQSALSLVFFNTIHLSDIIRSIGFGLLSAPFVVYFFTLLVERLERSRLKLASLVDDLRHEMAERIDAQQRLSETLSTLEQNHRDKSALLATISHELRTPLNGIIGLSRILLDEHLTESQRSYLQIIHVSAVALGHIFSDIIDLEKIDANRIELCSVEMDLPRFIQDMGNFATLMAKQHKLSFHLNCPSDLPQWVKLDSVRLSQILWNLISNAVKFTPKGQITLSIERQEQDTFAFILEDTGIGIPQEEIKRIFDMYYQVQSSGYHSVGSGIGLAISKIIAQLMGGDLKVKSKLNQGSTFTLTVQAPISEKPQHHLEKIPTHLRILLVEDMEINIIVAKTVLEKLGYKVDVAKTGKEAIETFQCHTYDLLLLDIQLPDMSGFDIAQHLRQTYQQPACPFPKLIALTANVIRDKAYYIKQGMDDVLHKPLEIDTLLATLAHYFGQEMSTIPAPTALKGKSNDKNRGVEDSLNLPMLNELHPMLGQTLMLKNLRLFKETLPQYLQELEEQLQQYQRDHNPKPVGDVAHKIKSACASLGLKKLQDLMQLAQHTNHPDWHNQIHTWVKDFHQSWQAQTDLLQAWLENHSR